MKIGRNDPCPCGSGRKYKKCCLQRDQEQARLRAAAPEDSLSPVDDDEGGVSLAVSSETFALWQALNTADSLPVEGMDAILEEMMRQPPEEVAWDQLLERLEVLEHPDLPGVIRRIIETVPLTADSGIGSFFSSAGEMLAYRGRRDDLAALTNRYLQLGVDCFEAPEVPKFVELLLMEGFEEEALRLAEHFFSLIRADEWLMEFFGDGLGRLVFELRVGRRLRDGSSASADDVGAELSRDLDGVVPADVVHGVAAAIAALADPDWTRQAFALPQPERRGDELDIREWRSDGGLFATLTRVAREAWQIDRVSPESVVRGLHFMCAGMYKWVEANPHRTATRYPNLLDYLRSAGLADRLDWMAPFPTGIDRFAVEIVLLAHKALLALAERHALIRAADAAESSLVIEALLDRATWRRFPYIDAPNASG